MKKFWRRKAVFKEESFIALEKSSTQDLHLIYTFWRANIPLTIYTLCHFCLIFQLFVITQLVSR